MSKINFRLLLTYFAMAATTARAAPTAVKTQSAGPNAAAPRQSSANGASTASQNASPATAPGAVGGANSNESSENDRIFQAKIKKMLVLTEASLKAVREQIVTSQGAPFLADLYLQMAGLLMKKGNALYYVQKEAAHEEESDFDDLNLTRFPAVVDAQKEAAEVLKKIIQDFPKFVKRPQAMYLLAVCYNSIDASALFQISAGNLIREYPEAPETLQAKILLGQRAVRAGQLDEALQIFLKIEDVKLPYERNLARQNAGRIYLRKEKFKEALHEFERVASDPELKDEISSENEDYSSLNSSLKREALLDSIQAYPHVYEHDARPAEYYSKLSPTEPLALEVMEKLAFRYVYLKRYDEAVSLLRAIGKTIRDPGRVVNMYRDILILIPLRRRAEISVSEVRYFLEKLLSGGFYDINPADRKIAETFYEEQLRELGTSSHDAAKRAQDPAVRDKLLERAKQFYLLYLGFFEKSPSSLKMAINLSDVYLLQKKYLDSGEYSLRIFSGDFGVPENKKELIENCLRALEKTNEESFYYQLRSRGLIIRAIRAYLAFDPQQRTNSQMRFLYAKTLYEQGLFEDALPALLDYMRAFPKTKFTTEAGDMVLEHYNVIEDFEGLQNSAKAILAMNLPDKAYQSKVAKIAEQSKLKRIESVVKEKSGPALSAKDYLGAALGLGDKELQSAALSQALARSKKEGDISTFLQSALSIANQEPDTGKRADILLSAAAEALKVTQYYQAMTIFSSIAENASLPLNARTKATGLGMTTALWLRDWDKLQTFQAMPSAAGVSREIRQGLAGQVWEALENPVPLPLPLINKTSESDKQSPELAVALYKAGARASSPETARSLQFAVRNCDARSTKPLCAWSKIASLEKSTKDLIVAFAHGPFNAAALQVQARSFQSLLEKYVELGDTGDEHLDQVSMIRQAELYNKFSQFLISVGKANPPLKSVLESKATEAYGKGKKIQLACSSEVMSLQKVSPASQYCSISNETSLDLLRQWTTVSVAAAPKSDPQIPAVLALQKKLFSDPGNAQAMVDLASAYAQTGQVHHALAASTQGLALFRAREAKWKKLLGCELPKVGLLTQSAGLLKQFPAESACRKQLLRLVLKK